MIKEDDYKLLRNGIFTDEHPFYKGLSVRYEKVDGAYMITIDRGEKWISLYNTYEEGLKIYNQMIQEGAKK